MAPTNCSHACRRWPSADSGYTLAMVCSVHQMPGPKTSGREAENSRHGYPEPPIAVELNLIL